MTTKYVPPANMLPGALIDYAKGQGIDPNLVAVTGLQWTATDDGAYTMHYLEFVLDDQGHRTLDGLGYAKRPRSARVSALPSIVVEVTR